MRGTAVQQCASSLIPKTTPSRWWICAIHGADVAFPFYKPFLSSSLTFQLCITVRALCPLFCPGAPNRPSTRRATGELTPDWPAGSLLAADSSESPASTDADQQRPCLQPPGTNLSSQQVYSLYINNAPLSNCCGHQSPQPSEDCEHHVLSHV